MFSNDGVGSETIRSVERCYFLFGWERTQILCIKFPKTVKASIREATDFPLSILFRHRSAGREEKRTVVSTIEFSFLLPKKVLSRACLAMQALFLMTPDDFVLQK